MDNEKKKEKYLVIVSTGTDLKLLQDKLNKSHKDGYKVICMSEDKDYNYTVIMERQN